MGDNWYAPASLVIQLSFLIAGVWFARNILRTMRASQEQLGAMLKLSITGVAADRHSAAVSANESHTADSPYSLEPSETGEAGLHQLTQSRPGQFAIARRKIAHWLQAPMSRSEAATWRRITNWLQAPAGS